MESRLTARLLQLSYLCYPPVARISSRNPVRMQKPVLFGTHPLINILGWWRTARKSALNARCGARWFSSQTAPPLGWDTALLACRLLLRNCLRFQKSRGQSLRCSSSTVNTSCHNIYEVEYSPSVAARVMRYGGSWPLNPEPHQCDRVTSTRETNPFAAQTGPTFYAMTPKPVRTVCG